MTPITASTRLTGAIGWPISHSLSPRMQNAAFEAVGLDWAYLPLPVDPADLHTAVRGLAALGFAGANVTIPHKSAVLDACDDVDEFARRARSVNTLVITEGRIHGCSTDGLAVVSAVEAPGADVLVLGAGGAAQAVALALLDAGASRLTVAARRPEAVAELVTLLRHSAGRAVIEAASSWPPVGGADLLVNATPLKEELVLDVAASGQVVDLAYLPDGRPTAFVAAARAAGCPVVVDGLEVLVRQGAASFERWTGVPAPVDAMRAAIGADR